MSVKRSGSSFNLRLLLRIFSGALLSPLLVAIALAALPWVVICFLMALVDFVVTGNWDFEVL